MRFQIVFCILLSLSLTLTHSHAQETEGDTQNLSYLLLWKPGWKCKKQEGKVPSAVQVRWRWHKSGDMSRGQEKGGQMSRGQGKRPQRRRDDWEKRQETTGARVIFCFLKKIIYLCRQSISHVLERKPPQCVCTCVYVHVLCVVVCRLVWWGSVAFPPGRGAGGKRGGVKLDK